MPAPLNRWTAEEKRRIVAEYEDAPWGSKGAVLRRYGVTSTRVATWTAYRDQGILETGLRKGMRYRMTPKKESAELGRLRQEIKRLESELEKSQRDKVVAEAAAEALGKASALLQTMLQSAEEQDEPEDRPSPDSSPERE